jgi:hypothetical protein
VIPAQLKVMKMTKEQRAKCELNQKLRAKAKREQQIVDAKIALSNFKYWFFEQQDVVSAALEVYAVLGIIATAVYLIVY